jgi:uncharacterized damage-inducible protein DinB
MYRTIDEFLSHWRYEAEATHRMMDVLTDESLQQRVAPEGRSLGRLAWHIVGTLHEMPTAAGLKVDAVAEDQPVPRTAREIADIYRASAAAVAEAVRNGWTDGDLEGRIPMYGETWTRSETLLSLLVHQIHHRGQMTVLMRQAGLRVPGVYGPAKEEWAAFGMSAPE